MTSVTAATVAPIPVERIPLYHWRPGTRLLAVGSRDGVGFTPNPEADARTFLRPVNAPLLRATGAKLGCQGLLAWWNTPALVPGGLDLLAEVGGPLVIATNGHGDDLGRWLDRAEAWVLLTTAVPGPWDAQILEQGKHVEVVIGLEDGAVLPDLPWERAAALHLAARRAAEADHLDAWCDEARDRLAGVVPIYDHHHQHTDCPCGERLVWRHAGRSRPDGLEAGACRACGRPLRGVWAAG